MCYIYDSHGSRPPSAPEFPPSGPSTEHYPFTGCIRVLQHSDIRKKIFFFCYGTFAWGIDIHKYLCNMFLARSATPASSVGAGVTLAAVNVADNRGKNKYTTCKEGEDTFCAEHLRDKEDGQRHLRRKFQRRAAVACAICNVQYSRGTVFLEDDASWCILQPFL